ADTDDNGSDFAAAAPAPRNTASPLHDCSLPVTSPPTGVGLASPSSLPGGASTLLTVAVTPGADPASTGIAVSCDLTAIRAPAPETFFDDGTNGDPTAGDLVFSDSTAGPA